MIRLGKATLLGVSLLGAAVLAASPALANGEHHGGGGGSWQGGWHGGFSGGYPGGWTYPVMPYQGVYTVNAPTMVVPQDGPHHSYPPQGYPMMPQADPEWQRMMERCSDAPHADNGVGGAVLGGIVGGVVGNRVVDGDRVLGTVAGAAVGAVAGAAIDKAEDRHAERDLREECDAWFAHSGAQQGYPGGYPGAGYGYPGYIMVPVMLPAQQKPCIETTTVTEEWVDVPVRQRTIPPRPAPRHDKRVKEKRVYTGS